MHVVTLEDFRPADAYALIRETSRDVLVVIPLGPAATALRAAGVPAREIATIIPPSKFRSVDGAVVGQELRDAVDREFSKGDPLRYFMDSPLHDESRTWMVTKTWENDTEFVLERLAKLAPEQSAIGYEAVP